MPNVSWEKLSEIIHEIKNERVMVSGLIQRLRQLDIRLEKEIDNMHDIIIDNGESSND